MNLRHLPSGTVINADHLLWACEVEGSTRYQLVSETEHTVERGLRLDDFLERVNPEQSPIVDPVINLDKLKPGAACCFSGADGNIQHGFIEHFGVDHATPYVSGTSHGDRFVKDLKN